MSDASPKGDGESRVDAFAIDIGRGLVAEKAATTTARGDARRPSMDLDMWRGLRGAWAAAKSWGGVVSAAENGAGPAVPAVAVAPYIPESAPPPGVVLWDVSVR